MNLVMVRTVKHVLDFIHLFEQVLTPNNDELIKPLNFLSIYRTGRSNFNPNLSKSSLFYRSNAYKEYFSSTANQWEFAINWLKQQMQTSWQWSPAQNVSNEDTDTRSFQRTRSAQFTLEQAQTLLQQTTTTTNNDPSTSELMELNDTHSQSSSQSTLVGSD